MSSKILHWTFLSYFFFDIITRATEAFPELFKSESSDDEEGTKETDYSVDGIPQASLESFGWLPIIWQFANEEVAKVDATLETHYMTFLTMANFVVAKAKADEINRG